MWYCVCLHWKVIFTTKRVRKFNFHPTVFFSLNISIYIYICWRIRPFRKFCLFVFSLQVYPPTQFLKNWKSYYRLSPLSLWLSTLYSCCEKKSKIIWKDQINVSFRFFLYKLINIDNMSTKIMFVLDFYSC